MNQEPYTDLECTALVFAARYCHNRTTGGTLKVVKYMIANWTRINERTQEQILKESTVWGVTNKEDWLKLYSHANYEPEEL